MWQTDTERGASGYVKAAVSTLFYKDSIKMFLKTSRIIVISVFPSPLILNFFNCVEIDITSCFLIGFRNFGGLFLQSDVYFSLAEASLGRRDRRKANTSLSAAASLGMLHNSFLET